jgi:erythritol transport system substrate-binding protein
MESLLSKNPNVDGVIAGNDEMALGAINALKEAGKIGDVKVLGFDGNQDAVDAVKDGTMVATVLQPIVEGTKKAIAQLDSTIRSGATGVGEEKQAIDCVLITKDNADKVKNFVLSE